MRVYNRCFHGEVQKIFSLNHLTLYLPETKIAEFANKVDLDGVAGS